MINNIFLLTMLFFLVCKLAAQTPEGFSYQAIIRDNSGTVLSDVLVTLNISIFYLQSGNQEIVYEELHNVGVNNFGLINLQIGSGQIGSGNFNEINWGDEVFFLNVKLSLDGGLTFSDMGNNQLLSVPYALYAKEAGNQFSGDYNDLSNQPQIPQNISQLINDAGFITSPDDADNDPTNELQNLIISGNELSITDGNTVTLPIQELSLTGVGGTTVTGTYPNLIISSSNAGTVNSIATTNGITGGPITEDGTIGLTGQALALHNLSTNGIIVRTGFETVTAREITAGQGITVNDGDGINGHPEISVNFGTTSSTVARGNHTHTGISPAGNTGHIQFNNAGVFGSSPDLYWDIDNARMGLGIDNPEGRMVVKQSSTAQAEEPLFEVKNKAGQTVFVIYEDSVRIYINDDPDKASKGTFAVSGRNTTKNYTGDILYVSPDSTRVFIGDDITKASKGTFAVSGRNTTKFETNQFLRIGRESARIYVEDNVASGERGGFAVGGLTSLNNDDAINFMYLTPNNYFIGHESGDKTTPGIGSIGKYNTFFGYQSGKENEIGHSNVFIGFKSGFNNNSGDNNSFVGNQAGFNNTGGSSNTFMGHECGYSNTTGNYNAFYGYKAGKSNTAGNSNLFIGNESGHDNISGSNNTFVGNKTGLKNNANQNTFIGTNTGTNTTTGGYNVFIGTFSGSANTEGSSNVFIGNLAGSSNTTAAANTYIGANAGHWKKEGRFNTYVGCQAGFGNGNVEGEFNVAIGWRAGMNIAGDNNVFIGTQAGLTETGSNKLYISNSNSNTLIYGDFETDSLVFNSSINVKKATHLPISTVSSSTTLNNGHHTVLVNTGVATITLPPASNSVGRIYIIKKIAATAGIITIDANLSETIDGTLTKSISAQWESITIQSNGSEWFIL